MGTETRPWWRQPLVHFLALGAVLFAVDLVLNPPEPPVPGEDRIVVSPEIEETLRRAWSEQNGRGLTEAERAAVMTTWLRNEALVREARRLGLEHGDTIIRRRLIQKMEFLLEGRVDVPDPDDATLEAWFTAHASDYTEPARATFVHRFFSRSRRMRARLRSVASGSMRSVSESNSAP